MVRRTLTACFVGALGGAVFIVGACSDSSSSGSSGSSTPPPSLLPPPPPGTGATPPASPPPGNPPPPNPPPGNPPPNPPPPPDGGPDADAASDPDTGSDASPPGIVTTAADRLDVAPCPSQALLTDTASFATLKTAMQTGTITYRDLPYNAGDANILKKKCGLEGFWNPTDNVDPIPVTGTPLLSTILATGNGGICSTNFVNFGADEGFAAAGTYRKEFQASSGGTTYVVRARVVAGGSGAGAKFSSFPITNADIQNTLVYEVDGAVTAHANLWSGILGAMTAPVPTAALVVKRNGTEIFNSTIDLICAATL